MCPFCASLYIQNLEECLAHSRFSIDIGWMIDYFSYKRQPPLQVGMSITDTDGDPEGKRKRCKRRSGVGEAERRDKSSL